MSKIDLPPGKYTLHMGVREAGGGAVGTIFTDLEVPDLETPPLAMSSLMVTSVATGGMPTGRADRLGDRLPIMPSTLREFRSNDELTIFAEVYDNEAAKPHTVDITASILASDGGVVFRHQERRSSSELRGTAGSFSYGSSIPLKELKPGVYSVRVEATSRLNGETKIAREVQFRITG